jgi:hypothetical protein
LIPYQEAKRAEGNACKEGDKSGDAKLDEKLIDMFIHSSARQKKRTGSRWTSSASDIAESRRSAATASAV